MGNSRIKYGWFEPERLSTGKLWPACRHFTVGNLSCPAPWNLIRAWTDPLRCDVAIAGSNPAVVEQLATHWQATTGRTPWVVRDRLCLPVAVEVNYPERVGLDRLLNAVAARQMQAIDEGVLIVDSGTATTVDVVTPDGAFAGGAILPGFALSSRALHHYTALLPELSLSELGPDTPAPLGRETRAALRSGIYWGQVGAIRELIRQLCRQLGWKAPVYPEGSGAQGDVNPDHGESKPRCTLILTGGGASWLEPEFTGARHIPSLAMHGLVLTAWSQGIGVSANEAGRA